MRGLCNQPDLCGSFVSRTRRSLEAAKLPMGYCDFIVGRHRFAENSVRDGPATGIVATDGTASDYDADNRTVRRGFIESRDGSSISFVSMKFRFPKLLAKRTGRSRTIPSRLPKSQCGFGKQRSSALLKLRRVRPNRRTHFSTE